MREGGSPRSGAGLARERKAQVAAAMGLRILSEQAAQLAKQGSMIPHLYPERQLSKLHETPPPLGTPSVFFLSSFLPSFLPFILSFFLPFSFFLISVMETHLLPSLLTLCFTGLVLSVKGQGCVCIDIDLQCWLFSVGGSHSTNV